MFKPCPNLLSQVACSILPQYMLQYMVAAIYSHNILLKYIVMIYVYNATIYSHHRWRAVWRDGLRVEIWQLRWWQPKSANYLLFIAKTKICWLSSFFETKICSFFQDADPCALLLKTWNTRWWKEIKFQKDCFFQQIQFLIFAPLTKKEFAFDHKFLSHEIYF